MKTFTIIGGVNGAGKSSLTGVLRQQLRDLGIVIDVDLLTAKMGLAPIEGGKLAIKMIGDCLQKGVSFTQETTLAGARVERTAREAKERHYSVRLFYVGIDTIEESLKRIKNRVEKGGHDIPLSDVKRRFSGRHEALARILPYCDEAVFFDNDNGFVQVAEYINGEIIKLSENKPRWLLELLEAFRFPFERASEPDKF